ncbi:hypothetical protein SK571_19980 [Lentzea sp. BCCO 10_0798]|uniref:Uncharacterized protein n=1 Tax=Lentzea kristufekii TaxID=3095430 RepID=A0ABU4TU19_9PSEU|nr:hypothetical protein [Lentzea sp. BCCO 10_0798]MDX8051675.1 hypothetical protein [Lentzea sp. BCCO 10_0798]
MATDADARSIVLRRYWQHLVELALLVVVTLHTVLRAIADLQRAGVVSVTHTCTTCRFFGRDEYPEPDAPHHCHLLRIPLPLAALRTDCPEHEPAITPARRKRG